MRLLIISDANIIFDFEAGNLIHVLFKLRYVVAVSDMLFVSELHESGVLLCQLGLEIIGLSSTSVEKMEELIQKYPAPSTLDHSSLALAIQEKCFLITGDKNLRRAANAEKVEVHGTLWIVEELLTNKVITLAEAKLGFYMMQQKNRRLPWNEVDKLLIKWKEQEEQSEEDIG